MLNGEINHDIHTLKGGGRSYEEPVNIHKKNQIKNGYINFLPYSKNFKHKESNVYSNNTVITITEKHKENCTWQTSNKNGQKQNRSS